MGKQGSLREGRRRRKGTPRRHGYRGYGSLLGRDAASYGGRVHWGRGFTGVQLPRVGGESLLAAGLFTAAQKEKSSAG